MAILLVHPEGYASFPKHEVLNVLRAHFKDSEFTYTGTLDDGRETWFTDGVGPADDTYVRYEIEGENLFIPYVSILEVNIGVRIPRDLAHV